MDMPFRLHPKGHRGEPLIAEGLLEHDPEALSDVQRQCMKRLNTTIQLEQETYLQRHPEVAAMLTIFIRRIIRETKRTKQIKDLIHHFVRPAAELDKEIRDMLVLPPDVPYTNNQKERHYEDDKLIADLEDIIGGMHVGESSMMSTQTAEPRSRNTDSSSFVSIHTSASTLLTPEPAPTPPLTEYETFYNIVTYVMEKAMLAKVTDEDIKYDTAYVELMRAVEVAMEIPVKEVRKDIMALLDKAHGLFERLIDDKDRMMAEMAWKSRLRKKMKRSIRRQKNFIGYETTPLTKSNIAIHESHKVPPSGVHHPQPTYNRYPKDSFGIYLPQKRRPGKADVTVHEFTVEDATNDVLSKRSGGTPRSGHTQRSCSTIRSGNTSASGVTTTDERSISGYASSSAQSWLYE